MSSCDFMSTLEPVTDQCNLRILTQQEGHPFGNVRDNEMPVFATADVHLRSVRKLDDH